MGDGPLAPIAGRYAEDRPPPGGHAEPTAGAAGTVRKQ